MQKVSNISRPNNFSETFNKSRNIRDNSKIDIKELYSQANNIDILNVFLAYNINLDKYHKECSCPIHKERTPSFNYYPLTNSWYCFGCKKGGGPIQFVALIEKISTMDAAKKLLGNFSPNPDFLSQSSDYLERQDIYLNFSKTIRSFIDENKNDPNVLEYAEKIGLIFDTLTTRHNLDNVGLKLLIQKLKVKLNAFDM